MSVRVAAAAVLTCLGDGPATFEALLAGRDGRVPLRRGCPEQLRVAYGYHLPGPSGPFAPSRWLAGCVARAAADAGLDASRERVACVVGTGLGELPTVEDTDDLAAFDPDRLHFADAVRVVLPGVTEVLTVTNACSAGGHALALAQDLIELDEADAVVVGATDAMTESMLAMIGRVNEEPADRVRPFDADRRGVLLGDGAAAMVLTRDGAGGLGRILATGLSCDAHHETAPSVEGIARAMTDALDRAGRAPAEVGLVVAHGTGTDLNDPAEAEALDRVLYQAGARPLVTAVKGAVGHTSGSAALISLDVALRCLATGRVPAVVGLREPFDGCLRLVRDRPMDRPPGLVQVDAFGFGGVNAVTLVEAG